MTTYKVIDVKVSDEGRVIETIDTGSDLDVSDNASDGRIIEKLLEDKWLVGKQLDDLYILWMSDRAGVYRRGDDLLLFELAFENKNIRSYRREA